VATQVLHWNDIGAHPDRITEVWDLERRAPRPVLPPQIMRYSY
jgi:hypothetical protein